MPQRNPTFSKNVTPLTEHFERHERELFTFQALTAGEQARFQARKRAEYARDVWSFLTDCVFTLDQVDAEHPIKPFPIDLDYLRFLVDVWQNPHHRKLAIPKSRRMTCSWSFIAAYLWDTAFKAGRFNGFVSKKEDDAGELVARAEFILEHIPEWRIPKALLPAVKNGKMSKQPPVLEFLDINSKLQGFPEGADQLRQFTLSGILGDECAFWKDAQKFYSASKPTLDGGGRMTLISSRSPSFFKKICYDRFDASDLSFPDTPPMPPKVPMTGIEIWKNPKNGFTVVDLHYTANPAKRSSAWRETVRSEMPLRDFLMEYEKSWQTYDGKPVFEDFIKGTHSTKGHIEIEPGLPLLLGWDFGHTPACLIAQLVGPQLRCLYELVHMTGSISKLAPEVWQFLRVTFPAWMRSDEQIINFVDPNGFKKSETDERTCAGIMFNAGFRQIFPGPVTWEARKQAVNHFLLRLENRAPCLLISEGGCPTLIEGFTGGYCYPEKSLSIEPAQMRPLKNRFSHIADSLQMLAHGATSRRQSYHQDIPTPNNYQQPTDPATMGEQLAELKPGAALGHVRTNIRERYV